MKNMGFDITRSICKVWRPNVTLRESTTTVLYFAYLIVKFGVNIDENVEQYNPKFEITISAMRATYWLC